MSDEPDNVYITEAQCHAWLRRMLCRPIPEAHSTVCDYWRTKNGVAFPAARPESTYAGKRVFRKGKEIGAFDRRYVLDLLNHVVSIYSLDAKFAPGDVFADEPPVKLVKQRKQ